MSGLLVTHHVKGGSNLFYTQKCFECYIQEREFNFCDEDCTCPNTINDLKYCTDINVSFDFIFKEF